MCDFFFAHGYEKCSKKYLYVQYRYVIWYDMYDMQFDM